VGYRVAALAELGVGRSVGIDLRSPDYRDVSEKQLVFARLGGKSGIRCKWELHEGSSQQLSFPDNTFDLIYSSSVLEHIHDLGSAMSEMARVLKPGGVMIHDALFYFAPSGGHASCTLDFPWGHARLTPSEFKRYLRQVRPYEYDYACGMHDVLFNRPPQSLAEVRRHCISAGLHFLSWKEYWLQDHLPDSSICKQVAMVYPTAGIEDLASNGVSMVLTK
jgi:SAM-dependent methyltransferase